MADVVLDYNQVIEETPVTGDSVPTAGGLVTFQFKCDVNGATDLSNSFFAADVHVASVTDDSQYLTVNGAQSATAANGIYIPDAYDFHAFPMLRCFQSITHIIDGQTVCNSQHPYADAVIVEKFLTTHSKANLENFQALSLCKQIDNGMKAHNIFTFDMPAMNQTKDEGGFQSWIYDWAKPGMFRQKYASSATGASYPAAGVIYGDENTRAEELHATKVHTLLFQPPFDLWRLRQPMHGGIHQIQLNLKAAETTVNWGGYMSTSCVGLSRKGALLYDLGRGVNDAGNVNDPYVDSSSFGDMASSAILGADTTQFNLVSPLARGGPLSVYNSSSAQIYDAAINAAKAVDSIYVDIKRLRLLRRVIRTSVPPQLSNVQYNFTEISMQHGTPASTGVAQQFLLPSTTFGLVFYWRESTNTDFDQVGVHPVIEKITSTIDTDNSDILDTDTLALHYDTAATAAYEANAITALTSNSMYRTKNLEFDLHDFQFTYGGATYPMQRIQRITGNKGSSSSNPYGWHRMMTLQNQLQGVYNSTMDDFPQSYGAGYGKGVLTRMDPHMMFFPVSRTGNSDNGILQVEWTGLTRRQTSTSLTASESPNVQLVVCALYDAQLNMQYSSNELQQIVLTQFK